MTLDECMSLKNMIESNHYPSILQAEGEIITDATVTDGISNILD